MQKYLYTIVSLGMIGSLYSMQSDDISFPEYLVDVNEMSTLDEDYEKYKLFYDQLKREDEHVNRLMELSTSDDKQSNASSTQKKKRRKRKKKKNTSAPERSWSIEEICALDNFKESAEHMRAEVNKIYQDRVVRKKENIGVVIALKNIYQTKLTKLKMKSAQDEHYFYEKRGTYYVFFGPRINNYILANEAVNFFNDKVKNWNNK